MRYCRGHRIARITSDLQNRRGRQNRVLNNLIHIILEGENLILAREVEISGNILSVVIYPGE